MIITAPSYAGNIKDYQIKGIHIGASALDYISEEIIKKNTRDFYNVFTKMA
jgi:hypothetical protein